MPVTKSALKALKKDVRKTETNKQIKTKYKTAIKKMQKNPSVKNLSDVYSSLDKAVKKKIIHKNKSARIKANIAKLLSKTASYKRSSTKQKLKKNK